MGNVIGVDTSYTGNPVSFVAANGGTMKSISVPLTYTQDLHGYDSPWPAGGGKNLLPTSVDGIKSLNVNGAWSGNEYTFNGVKFTINTDQDGNVTGISANGTASADTDFTIVSLYTFPAGSYTLNGCPSGGSTSTYRIFATNWGSDTGSGVTATLDGSTQSSIRINIKNGTTVSNQVYKPMVRLSSNSDASYAPYSNICPITGRTGLNLYRTGRNLLRGEKYQFSASTVIIDQNVSYSTNWEIFLKAGTYTLSSQTTKACYLYCRNSDSTINERSSKSQNPHITVTTAKDDYVAIWFYDTTISTDDIISVQLELGSTATSYEPYNGNTYAVDWTSEAGTVYGGTVDVVTGVLTASWTYKEFNGTEAWNANSNYCSLFGQEPSVSNTDMTQKSNVFVAGGNGYAEYNKFRAQTNGAVVVGNKKEDGTGGRWADAAAFKSFLAGLYSAGTPFAVCYELATPQTFQLTPNQIAALVGQNYIWANNNQTLSVVLTAPMTGFAGWLIKCVTNGTPIEIPLKYMRAETYTVTPDQRMEWSAERDVTGVLHRETVQNLPPKIEFNTPLMTNADINALNSIIKAAFTSYLQRNITIQFYDPERDQYWEWDCYMPDVHYQIRNADTTNHVINYEELRYAFIGY